MARPSYEEILNIKKEVNIVDVVRDYIPLVQRGKNYFGICPFHDDHNPSMSVSTEKQMYKCFVCGAAGDVFTFVKNYEKISYEESVSKIASKIGINIKFDSKKKESDIYSNQYEIYDIANKYYQNNLNTSLGKIAKNYLKERNISDDIIKYFQIGLSLSDNKLYDLLKSKNFDDDLLVKSGICIRKDKINDIFKNRIMFPLWDINGRTIGFSGRVYEGNDQSKYVNTMETDIFKKGSLLYNYHNAREYILKNERIIIVEGFMDVIRLHTVGIDNVVATMGTAITNEQLNLIRKVSKNVILMFDGDAAGNKATESFIENSKDIDFNIKIVRLEDNLDPDEYILKNGKEKMVDHLNHAYSVFDYKIINSKKSIDFNNTKDVSKFINDIIPILSNITDDIELDLELNKISKLSGVSIDLIKSKIVKKDDNIKIVSKVKKELRLNKYDKASMMILFYMIKNNSLINYYYNNLSYLSNDLDKKLANSIVLFYKKYKSFNIDDFVIYLEDDKDLINRLLQIDELKYKTDYTLDEIDGYFNVIKEYSLNKEINELEIKLKNETNPVVKKELASKIIDIKLRSVNNEKN